MKKILLLLTSLVLIPGLYAQEYPFDDLPEIVRQDMLIEEEDFQDFQPADSLVINSDKGYYKGSQRTGPTDTIIYYKWHRVEEDWIPVHRLIKSYDAAENVVSSLLQHKRPDGDWFNGVLKSYAYDNGHLMEVLVQFWHPENQAWADHMKKLFNYYDDGNMAEIVHQVWMFDLQQWGGKFRKVFVYNADGTLSSDTIYHKRPFQQDWFYKQLDEFGYNDAGFRILHTTSHFIPDTAYWKGIHREIFNPDAAGLVQDITVQHWCRPMQDWQNIKWIGFTYNDAGLASERLVKYWHRFDSTWVDANRNLFSYDASGNMDTMIFQRWRQGAEMWVNKELNDFEYDDAGTLLSRLTQLWDPYGQTWRNFRLMELVIDLKHLAGPSSLPETQASDVSIIFCNPCQVSQNILVNGPEGEAYIVRLAGLSGQAVFSRQVNSGEVFSVGNQVTPGLYVITVSDGNRRLKSSRILITR
jgi:hypothetical protein